MHMHMHMHMCMCMRMHMHICMHMCMYLARGGAVRVDTLLVIGQRPTDREEGVRS